MNKRQKKKSIKKNGFFSFYNPSFSLLPSYYSNYKKIRVIFNAWECHDKQLRKVKSYRLKSLRRNLYKL